MRGIHVLKEDSLIPEYCGLPLTGRKIGVSAVVGLSSRIRDSPTAGSGRFGVSGNFDLVSDPILLNGKQLLLYCRHAISGTGLLIFFVGATGRYRASWRCYGSAYLHWTLINPCCPPACRTVIITLTTKAQTRLMLKRR